MQATIATTDKPTRRIHPVRWAILGLLVCLTLLVVCVIIPDWRKLQFKYMGRVTIDGSTFYMHAGDNYLTQLVVNTGEYEPTETQLVRQILKDGDVFIDVGANIGWYTVHSAKIVGANGRVYAFEPEPNNLDLLRKNVEANNLKNVTVDERALSSEAGSFKLFLEKENLGKHSLVVEHAGERYINVQTMRFDDYWANRGDIRLVKIDTEGAEGMILDGMRDTLRTQKNMELIVEFAPFRLVKSGYDPDKFLSDMYQLGYKASIISEEERRVIALGTPSVKDLNLPDSESVTNLHFKR